MLGVLVESRRRRSRSFGGTTLSVVVHLAIIAAALAATGNGEIEPTRPDVLIALPVPNLDAIDDRATGGQRGAVSSSAVPDPGTLPPLTIDDRIDVGIPDAARLLVDSLPIEFGSGTGRERGGSGSSSAGDAGSQSPLFEWMVDRAARPLSGNPAPDYPRILRGAGVEGSVLVQFVIDTTGRADMRTVRVLQAAHTLFEQSVREAVARMRFEPAQVADRPVRVLVQQSFAFRIAR